MKKFQKVVSLRSQAWIGVTQTNSLETRAFCISKAEMPTPHCNSSETWGLYFVTIETCIPFLWQTWSIPHKAHICTAGIEQWRSCINGVNDLETNHRTRNQRTPLACKAKRRKLKPMCTGNVTTGYLFYSYNCSNCVYASVYMLPAH